MITLDKKSFVPIYHQLKEAFREMIESRKLKPGSKIPSEVELAARYGISRMTARRAITELTKDGLVVRRHGKGTFTADTEPEPFNTKTGNIAVLLPDLMGFTPEHYRQYYFQINDLLDGMMDGAMEGNRDLCLLKVPPYEKELSEDNRFMQRLNSYAGVLYTAASSSSKFAGFLKRQGIPAVSVMFQEPSIHPKVCYYSYKASMKAAKYLAEKGYRRIGTINTPLINPPSHYKLDGFREGLRKHDIDMPLCRITKCEASSEDGYHAMKQLLKTNKKNPLDAVFCVTDTRAYGAVKAIRDAGLRIPHDIAVLGYNDEPDAAYQEQPLSTVRVPRSEIGTRAVLTLLDVIAGKRIPDIIELEKRK